MVTYHSGSLFDSNGSMIGLACHCRGVWHSGIELEFAERYPNEYQLYIERCQDFGHHLAGSSFIIGKVVCLFTNKGYGVHSDPPFQILAHTESAVEHLEKSGIKEIHIPKINSGSSNVPWEATEQILSRSKIHFHIWTP